MPNSSIPNLDQTLFPIGDDRFSRTQGIERYFFGNDIGVGGASLGTSFDLGLSNTGAKGT